MPVHKISRCKKISGIWWAYQVAAASRHFHCVAESAAAAAVLQVVPEVPEP
jgi:hypothetical protein